MARFEVPEVDYDRYSNRQLAAIPLGVLAVALVIVAVTWATTGAPVALGTDFSGGTEFRVAVDAGSESAESVIRTAFPAEPASIREIPSQGVYVVTFGPEVDATAAEDAIGCASDESVECLSDAQRDAAQKVEYRASAAVSAAFGEALQGQALVGVVAAFAGMGLLVFGLFRTFVPSVAVVVSAFSDIVIPVALMNLFGIELSLGTVAALLMLIGYSVDSDILLNNHILRRSGDFYESTYRAMRTGVTMTLTSLAAMIVLTIVATIFGIGLLASIGTILVFGLTADLMNTYMLNLSLLRWYKFEGVAR
ncbi:protein translocase subunit SecF [Halobaculum sp. MBLA0147]|uniref:protein translocase subunit SecF n=1 Tax=Halobaculum sp. MBLA0147 TaxID=3079934 RepID=UPI0035255067